MVTLRVRVRVRIRVGVASSSVVPWGSFLRYPDSKALPARKPGSTLLARARVRVRVRVGVRVRVSSAARSASR